MTPEELDRIMSAIAGVHVPGVDYGAKARATIARLEREVQEARAAIARVGVLLSHNGCDCECEHRWDEHDEDCERCFACQVQDAITLGGG